MNKPTAYLSLVALLLLNSCAISKHRQEQLKPATVLEVHTTIVHRDISAAPGIWHGTHLALIGSQVGTGAAAHIIGAAVGALAGGGLGYAAERERATTRLMTAFVQLDDGMKVTLASMNFKRAPVRGDRVWVKCDRHGMPLELLEPTKVKTPAHL